MATASVATPTRCVHGSCPPADAMDWAAARTVACHPEQGWSQLCNGAIVFDDTGALLPDGTVMAPHRGPAVHQLC